ncbi:acyl carrier protein [Pseudonocardia sp. DSM 110487]|jgi:aryl carrier-like protein|nr:acyl carrier protein [Pseudonocardia sp. DSM 110487]
MTLSAMRIEADVADVLRVDVGDLDREEDLRDQGLDSVRMMDLLERWRRAGAKDIDFITLAEDPRLSRWTKMFGVTGEGVEE